MVLDSLLQLLLFTPKCLKSEWQVSDQLHIISIVFITQIAFLRPKNCFVHCQWELCV